MRRLCCRSTTLKKAVLTACLLFAAGTTFSADMPKAGSMMQKQDSMQKPAMKRMKHKGGHMKMKQDKKQVMSTGMK